VVLWSRNEPERIGEVLLIPHSVAPWALRGAIATAAQRSAHVLVLGESGTGKELVAQALHARSDRAAKTLVSRNATTIPEGLLDAELFGNLRNYPNPARRSARDSSGRPAARRSCSTSSPSCRRACRRTCCACSTAASTSAWARR